MNKPITLTINSKDLNEFVGGHPEESNFYVSVDYVRNDPYNIQNHSIAVETKEEGQKIISDAIFDLESRAGIIVNINNEFVIPAKSLVSITLVETMK